MQPLPKRKINKQTNPLLELITLDTILRIHVFDLFMLLISAASNEGEFKADIVFALDYSSSVTEEELQMEINFVHYLSQSWDVTSGNSTAALVSYGDSANTVIAFYSRGRKVFSDQLMELKTPECRTSQKWRRMDLALSEAAYNLNAVRKGTRSQHQLVVLFTAGKQLSDQGRQEDNDLLASASEKLSSEDIKVVIVPVGFETDFKELGLIVKRPQCLFPLSAFRDLTLDKAQEIASCIKKTIGGMIICVTCIVILTRALSH